MGGVYLAIKPHPIAIEGGANGDGGSGREVVGIEGDADAIVHGEDEGLVALPPVLDHCDVGRSSSRRRQDPTLRLGRHRLKLRSGKIDEIWWKAAEC